MSARHEFADQTEIVGFANLPWGSASGSEVVEKTFDFSVGPSPKTRVIFRRREDLGPSTAEQLFDATAGAKIWTSQVAMRLNRAVRDRLFRQLDNLHNDDDWLEGDVPVSLDSFKSLVRGILMDVIGGKPGLSLTPQGNLIALWTDGGDKLAIEFQPGDTVRYLWSQRIEDDFERASGTTSLRRLPVVLSPLNAERLFRGS